MDRSRLLHDLIAQRAPAGADAADAVLISGTSLSVQRRLGKTEQVERSEGRDLGLRVFVGNRPRSSRRQRSIPRRSPRSPSARWRWRKVVPEDPYAGLAEETPRRRRHRALDLADPDRADDRRADGTRRGGRRGGAGGGRHHQLRGRASAGFSPHPRRRWSTSAGFAGTQHRTGAFGVRHRARRHRHRHAARLRLPFGGAPVRPRRCGEDRPQRRRSGRWRGSTRRGRRRRGCRWCSTRAWRRRCSVISSAR